MCLRSKVAVLIVLWSVLAYLSYYLFASDLGLLLSLFTGTSLHYKLNYVAVGQASITAFMLMFSIIGGLLGDIKWGRYRIIKYSLVLLISLPLLLFITGCQSLILVYSPESLLKSNGTNPTNLAIVLASFELISVLVVGIAYITLIANIIPFAMDQLQDLPSQETGKFICWYLWCPFVAGSLTQILYNTSRFINPYQPHKSMTFSSYTMIISGVLILIFLIVSLCLMHHKQRWFYIEPGSINPYKLVYKVSKFALQHKVPIHRSAFTYCEDELPSRLDLGKTKYGGPFLTEEVEDVKVFYGILKVIFSFVPTFLGDGFGFMVSHLYGNTRSSTLSLLLQNRVIIMSSFIMVSIPLYLFVRKLSIFRFLPTLSMLRRIEIGIIFRLVSLLFLLAVDIAAHVRNEELGCMFGSEIYPPVFTEFQSPRSMKGMLIGLSLATQGLCQLVGLALTIPFFYWRFSYPSCGFGFNVVSIIFCLIVFINFVRVAKNYRYRVRDEPCRVREYAENYYSNLQQEKFYDYSESVAEY